MKSTLHALVLCLLYACFVQACSSSGALCMHEISAFLKAFNLQSLGG